MTEKHISQVTPEKNITAMFRISLLYTALFLCCKIAVAQTAQSKITIADPAEWIAQNFRKGKLPPFSFRYNGTPSSSFLKNWNHSMVAEKSENASVKNYTVTYTDRLSKLKVECKIIAFVAFNAVEWVLHFRNEGGRKSGQITELKAIDLQLTDNKATAWNMYGSSGSNHSINDFKLRKSSLVAGARHHMEPQSGRSSDNTAFPFFNLEAEGTGGIITAIGWTGTWFADISRNGNSGINLAAGMKNTDLFLYPGESIRTPSICILAWHGDNFLNGHNQFRKLVLAHHSRKVDGRFAEYPLSGGFEWGDPAPCNEYTCLTEEMAIAFVNRYKQFGIMPEVMWLDAGWYAGSGGPSFSNVDWWNSIGTWRVDTTRFPNGLKPLSDAVHKAGAKFMVWFEPERVMAGSEFATKFPQWMLQKENEKKVLLFDLGNAEARKWLSEYIGDFLEENGIDYYRQDFNMPIDAYWQFNDSTRRKGIREIRYIEGLYAYWDYLLERFPNLLIDNCASGGRRLDLETTKRSAPLWRTDYNYGEPNGYQNHTYGLNFYLPLHGTGVYAFDDYSFNSALGTAMVINWELTGRGGDIRLMQKQIARFKELRPYYYEDYYPLSGLGDLTTMDVWLAYQLNKQSDHSGVVVAYRRKDNKDGKITVKLSALDAARNYQITNLSDNSVEIKNGRQMMEGLEIVVNDTPGSVLLKYERK